MNFNQKPEPLKPLGRRGYFCRACKGTHARQETVRQCHQDHYGAQGRVPSLKALSDADKSAISSYIEETSRPDWTEAWSDSPLVTGNYYVPVRLPSGEQKARSEEKYLHVRIGWPTSGKWSGFFFVSVYDDTKKKLIPVRSPVDRTDIVRKIRNSNWHKFMTNYGRAYGECPVCETPLEPDEIPTGVHRKNLDCYRQIFG